YCSKIPGSFPDQWSPSLLSPCPCCNTTCEDASLFVPVRLMYTSSLYGCTLQWQMSVGENVDLGGPAGILPGLGRAEYRGFGSCGEGGQFRCRRLWGWYDRQGQLTDRPSVAVEGAMAYSAEISRTNPSCFLFLIDQSGSMAEPFAGQPDTKKSQEVAAAVNRLLQTLVLRCAKGHEVLDRFHVGVIGYGADQVGPALGGALSGCILVPVSKLAASPLRVEQRTKRVPDGAGGLVEQTVKFPVWFEPAAKGKTPMCAALDMAWNNLAE